jgi:hypothetical protein
MPMALHFRSACIGTDLMTASITDAATFLRLRQRAALRRLPAQTTEIEFDRRPFVREMRALGAVALPAPPCGETPEYVDGCRSIVSLPAYCAFCEKNPANADAGDAALCPSGNSLSRWSQL